MKLIFSFITLLSFTAFSQGTDKWTEYMTPGKCQELFKLYAGEFEVILTDAGSESTVATFKASNTMILGDRFLEIKQSGEIMDMAFEGLILIGFDTGSEKAELTQISNFGTGTGFFTGTCDPTGKKIVVSGQMNNPVTDQPVTSRQEILFINSDTFVMVSYDMDEKGVFKPVLNYEFRRLR